MPLCPKHAPSLWWTHSWPCRFWSVPRRNSTFLTQTTSLRSPGFVHLPLHSSWYCFIPHHNLHPSLAVPTCLHVLLHLFSILSTAPDCWPWVPKTLHSLYLYSLKPLLSTWVPFGHTFILSCCSSPSFLCVKYKTKHIWNYFTNLHNYL